LDSIFQNLANLNERADRLESAQSKLTQEPRTNTRAPISQQLQEHSLQMQIERLEGKIQEIREDQLHVNSK
jgi:uncharacterized protein (UPF0335 family)